MQERQLVIGSQWYINRDTSIEEIREGIAAMAAHGLGLVRIFALWDHLEPQQGHYTWDRYDALFDAAAAHGMGVIPTLFAVSPPGWMNLSNDSQALGPLEDEAYWRLAMEHVRRVVEHWRGHPALHSWIVWNEPSRVPPSSAAVTARWQAFLQKRYGSLAALNAHRYRQAPDWQSAASPEVSSGSAFRGFEHACDRLRFAVDELQHYVHALVQEVRRVDPDHLIHVNPHNVGSCVLAAGQSLWREAELVDFIGVSAHPPWHSTRFPAWRVAHSIEFFADIARSASRDPDRFWISELQGGPTLYSAEHSSGPDAGEIQRWLAHGFASGAEAILFWCFNQRSGGFEVGEWGLMGLDNRPTQRLRAVAESAEWLQRHHALLACARPWPARIAILHSEDSERLQAVMGRGDAVQDPRNCNAHWDAIAGAWLLCRDAGHEVVIIDEDRLAQDEGIPQSVQTILVPAASALTATACHRLQAFAQAGGRVIADGLCAWSDADAHRADPQAHAALFACDLHDILGLHPQGQIPHLQTSGLPACLFQGALSLPPGQATAIDHWPDGSVGICRHDCGQGEVIRIATIAFAAYFAAQHQPEALQGLRRGLLPLLPQDDSAPLQQASFPEKLWMRRLQTPQGCLCALINHGEDAPIVLEDVASVRLEHLCREDVADPTRFHLSAGAVRWVLVHSQGSV
ncbi:MAG: hypothetical protein EA401_07015 [Planctomycetota bacterium]|nr:MAG: hypothetical protein EA401_07015 [Planctomycetota bacterium]